MTNSQPNFQQPRQNDQTEGLAVASLVVGLLSAAIPVLAGIAAVILGHTALSRIKVSKRSGRGMAIAGTILGYANIVFFGLGILAAIVLPILVHQQGGSSNFGGSTSIDASVKGDLRYTVESITNAQASSASKFTPVVSYDKTRVIVVAEGQSQIGRDNSLQLNTPKAGAGYLVCAYNEDAAQYSSKATAYGYDSVTGALGQLPGCK